MRTIAIINQKGGCGKTTVSINLAAVLAEAGHRTLLVDMDPQSHCSLGLAVPESQLSHTIGDLLRSGLGNGIEFSDIVWQLSRTLDLAPSSMELATLEQELSQFPDRDRRLSKILDTLDCQYDFCIIDCPPSIGLLTFNALRASQEVVIPVETGYFALQGAIKQDATIEMLMRRTGQQVFQHILPTMYDVRTKLAREILSELRRHFGEKLMPIVINFNSKLKEAASFGQPITQYDPASRGMQDFEKLTAWLIANPPMHANALQQVANTQGSPILSRAAELAERARALSARSAAITSKIASDPYVAATGIFQKLPTHVTVSSGHTVISDPAENFPTHTHTGTPARLAAAGRVAGASPPVEPIKQTSPRDPHIDRLYGVRETHQGVLFVQPLNQGHKVSIAGDFNNWSSTASPLEPNEQLGVWQACINVPPGRYRYRLVIDGEYQADPYNQTCETNQFGELNNVLEVKAAS